MSNQLVARILDAMREARHVDALELARTLSKGMPGNESALSLLAACEQNMGNLQAALDILQRLTRKHPQTWQHWNNLGNVARSLGEGAAALAAYQRALRLHPDGARLQANIGLLHLNRGEYPQAREHLLAACALKDSETGMCIWAAVASHACLDEDAAFQLVRDWRQWPRQSDEAMLELGWLLVQLGAFADGDEILRGHFQDESSRIRAGARRVLAHERVNHLDEARTLLQSLPPAQGIADPETRQERLNATAIMALRDRDYALARRCYEEALATDVAWRDRTPLYFGLARACDRLNDGAAALDALVQGHRLQLGASNPAWHPGAAHTGLLRIADQRLTAAEAASWRHDEHPDAMESPVFVVGFPRSGTTLIEQMLAAHDRFVSTDEQPFVRRMIEWLDARGLPYPGGLTALSAADLDALHAVYWGAVREVAAIQPGVRLVDKNPLNMLALPMMLRAFPQARIIYCQRHPCDAILSCYLQQFRDPDLAAMCATLERLAHEYASFDRQWTHHVEILNADVLTCRYEDLVTDIDAGLARLGAYLDVEDVANMKNFHARALARGFISTPSYAQVVEPLRTDAIGHWRRYREAFAPLLPILQPILDHWNYDA
jgi:tetratricopeptide (TPR) repeat protein